MAARVLGKVIGFTPQGNLVTDISADRLRDAPRDERFCVRCDEHQTNGLFDSQHQQPESTLIARLSDSGRLEIEIVGDSAQLMLGVPLGESVEVSW